MIEDNANLGKSFRVKDANGRYIEFCKSTFPYHLDLNDLTIVVDCANGAAYSVGPAVFVSWVPILFLFTMSQTV